MRLNQTIKVILLAFSLTATAAQAQEAPSTSAKEAKTASAVPEKASPVVPLVKGLPDFTEVVKNTENGVVNIRTEETINRQSGIESFGDFGGNDPDEFFRFFFGPDIIPSQPRSRRQPQPNRPNSPDYNRTVPSGLGSGFIISKDGYIITNNHVIKDASKIIVTLNSGKEYTAKVIGADERTDIALVKIKADKLEPMKIGTSHELKKGQWVLAIGSPFGLDSTVTVGVVSAINRDTGDYLPFIQTDVAVNPGNSGGPLIDVDGQVVGVNSQIVSRSGGFMGISLSIPIDEAMKVVDQLKATGKVTRGRIGVAISEVKEEVAKALGLPNSTGALVSSVDSGSPAQKAGIHPGDVILKFDGNDLKKWSDLPRLVGQTEPGKEVSIGVWRRGKMQTVRIKVENIVKNGEASDATNDNNATVEDNRLGLGVRDLPNNLKEKYDLESGVLVKSVSGVTEEAGLQENDVILAINDQDAQNAKQFQDIVKELPDGKVAALLIRRDNTTQWVPVIPSK